MTRTTSTLAASILLLISMSAGLAQAQAPLERRVDLLPSEIGTKLDLTGVAILSTSMLSGEQSLTVAVSQTAGFFPENLNGHTFVVTVSNGRNTFDVGAITLREGMGRVSIKSGEGRSPAFPLTELRSVSIRWSCRALLSADL